MSTTKRVHYSTINKAEDEFRKVDYSENWYDKDVFKRPKELAYINYEDLLPWKQGPISAYDKDSKFTPWLKSDDKTLFFFYNFLSRPIQEIIIELKGVPMIRLPWSLKALADEIEHSKYILNLEENWDGEGSTKYEEKVWINAIVFVGNYALSILNNKGSVIPMPKISHGPKGSIDILWKTSDYHLLMNIDRNKTGSLYGYSKDRKQETESTFSIEDYNIELFPILVN